MNVKAWAADTQAEGGVVQVRASDEVAVQMIEAASIEPSTEVPAPEVVQGSAPRDLLDRVAASHIVFGRAA